MERIVTTTKDGSKTLLIKDLNENYHSGHGALQEARHVFINNGLILSENNEIHILELGFGTGLNVLVTLNEFLRNDKCHVIHYYTLEKYPVKQAEITELAYESLFEDEKIADLNAKIHACEWEKKVEIVPDFYLTKFKCDFFELENIPMPSIDLVYFDCFGARVQPDLWEQPLLEMVADKMGMGALFTTYSSKGSVRRILKELGFKVEKRPGPPGKREMMIAWKGSEPTS
jgi:tRNA U34 5-methylaminomethyl-2-thiouridine-forming methyltransferase MnmC